MEGGSATGLAEGEWTNVTAGPTMFTPDGKQLVFGSNRNAPYEGSTNVFIADWVEEIDQR